MSPSVLKLEKAHMLHESESVSLMLRWLLRCKVHMAQIGKIVLSLIKGIETDSLAIEENYGLEKLLILVEQRPSSLTIVAKSTKDGSLVWKYELETLQNFVDIDSENGHLWIFTEFSAFSFSLRSGELLSTNRFISRIETVFPLKMIPGIELEMIIEDSTCFGLKTLDSFELFNCPRELIASQYLVTEENGRIIGYFTDGNNLIPTWTFGDSSDIVAFCENSKSLTSSIGITRLDRSVLYKYLNPNTITVATVTDGKLLITILDGITGSILHQQQQEETIDPHSVQIVHNDNWVIVSYYSIIPLEQRVLVLDLFTTKEEATKRVKSSFTTEKPTILASSFIFPERIQSMISTNTKFGITIKSVLALTESGSLFEIPKYILNSRRIQGRKFTKEDTLDDFRLSPYSPVIPRVSASVLNHKHQLQILENLQQQILVKATELESTATVCFVNDLNEFCTFVQPSLGFDTIQASFDRGKLIATIGVLLIGYFVSKPLVASKKLNSKWVD